MALIDLSHVIEHGMVTYGGLPGPHICDYWTREGSAAHYDDGSSFQIGRIDMVANTGTYLDAPFHRYADGADLAGLALDQLAALPGLCVRSDGAGGGRRTASKTSTSPARRCWSTPAGTGTGAPTPMARTTLSHRGRRAPARRARRQAGRHRQLQYRRHQPPHPPRPHHPARRERPDLRAYDQSRRAARRTASPSPPCRRRSPAWAPSRSAPSPGSAARNSSLICGFFARRSARRASPCVLRRWRSGRPHSPRP